jgi:hypothetical protein
MRGFTVALASLAFATLTQSSVAGGVHVVRHIDGYTCMMLNQTSEQAVDLHSVIHVFAEPASNARAVGVAMPVVAVREPVRPVNGFLAALFPNGSTVWIPAGTLRPYHSLGAPDTRCVPAVMSNGLVGFDYTD